MQITPLSESIEQLAFETGPERTPGLHLSAILTDLARDLDPKRYTDGPMNWNKIECGFSFETVLENAFRTRRVNIVRPGEISRDGILMSPDGIDMDSDPWVLEEFKLTWMSERDAPEHTKFAKWIWQIKSYCGALGLNDARLRALFMNGDYRENRNPTYRVWHLWFDDEELDENWRMVLGHARLKGMLP